MNKTLKDRVREMGVINFVSEKFHREVQLNKSSFQGNGGNSSISDDDNWVGYCDFVTSNLAAFHSFRRYKVLHDVLEHVTFPTAVHYLKAVEPRFKKSHMRNLAQDFDRIGNPFKYRFQELGKISSLFFDTLK